MRIEIPGRTAADSDCAVIYEPLKGDDLVMLGVASMASQMSWGKPSIGKAKRDKHKARMAKQSRKRNRQ